MLSLKTSLFSYRPKITQLTHPNLSTRCSNSDAPILPLTGNKWLILLTKIAHAFRRELFLVM
jgi:hypothetical protein